MELKRTIKFNLGGRDVLFEVAILAFYPNTGIYEGYLDSERERLYFSGQLVEPALQPVPTALPASATEAEQAATFVDDPETTAETLSDEAKEAVARVHELLKSLTDAITLHASK